MGKGRTSENAAKKTRHDPNLRSGAQEAVRSTVSSGSGGSNGKSKGGGANQGKKTVGKRGELLGFIDGGFKQPDLRRCGGGEEDGRENQGGNSTGDGFRNLPNLRRKRRV